MANTNTYIDKIVVPTGNGSDTITANFIDSSSGYMKDVQVNGTSITSGGTANLITNTAYNASSNKIATMADVGSAGGGTVTSVGVDNATNGGLTVSGSPVTGSGTITVGHSNVLTNAQTTQAVYPITIDKNGHVASYGSAVTIPDDQIFWVTGTVTSTTTDYVGIVYYGTVDYGYSDISNAISDGKFPVFKMDFTGTTINRTIIAPFSASRSGSVQGTAIFEYAGDNTDNGIGSMAISVQSSAFSTTPYTSGETYKVNVTVSNGVYSLNRSYTDVQSAISNEKFVYLYDTVSSYIPYGGYNIAVLVSHYNDDPENDIYLHFVSMSSVDGGSVITPVVYTLSAEDVLTISDGTVSNATTATYATNINNSQFTNTSYVTYYLPILNGYTAGNKKPYTHNGAALYTRIGTASAVGGAYLRLGNTTNSGTAGNMRGGIDLYAQSGAYYTRIQTTNTLTANNTLTLPTGTGTIALTSDIPTVPGILSGTSAPTSSQGSDGDIYIRY